jgi:dihydrolipoamide dehydrogenase
MNQNEYDVVIIGAGPGGYVTAIRAVQLGLSACVIEKDRPGGVCLNIGCIPSKALIHQAEIFSATAGLEEMGITVDLSGFQYDKVFQKSRKIADTLSNGVKFLLKKNKVELVEGTAKIVGENEVEIDSGDRIKGKQIIVATGSSPRQVAGFEFDGKIALSSDHALMLEELPKRVLILGGGAIGCEFAHIMKSFGVEVTIVEMLDHLLPNEDEETVKILARTFKKRKIKVLTSAKATALEKNEDSAVVTVEDKKGKIQEIEVDKILVVVGRGPNTEGIGLENVGIHTDRGFIPVGDYYRTSVDTIFAIGDVVASPQLAHVASAEGKIVVEHIAGKNPEKKVNPDLIPGAVYTEPQVASFGLTLPKAQEQGQPAAAASFPYRAAGKAVAIGQIEGQVKIVYNTETKKILGAQIVGADATELIHEILLAKKAEILPEEIATMIHAHPTLSETIMETARSAGGWVIHA